MRRHTLIFMAIVIGIPALGILFVNIFGVFRYGQNVVMLGMSLTEYQNGQITIRTDAKTEYAEQFEKLTLTVTPKDKNFGSVKDQMVEVECTGNRKEKTLDNCVFDLTRDPEAGTYQERFYDVVLNGKMTTKPTWDYLEMKTFNDSILADSGATIKMIPIMSIEGIRNVSEGDNVQLSCRIFRMTHRLYSCEFLRFLPE